MRRSPVVRRLPRAGTLAVMAGGDKRDIDEVTPVMNELAATFTHFGPAGAGQVAKMVNQILVLNNYAVLAEALALAEAGGIDASKIPEALKAGHAGSNLLQSAFPRMIERDYAPLGYARQILKDLDMLHDLAKDAEIANTHVVASRQPLPHSVLQRPRRTGWHRGAETVRPEGQCVRPLKQAGRNLTALSWKSLRRSASRRCRVTIL